MQKKINDLSHSLSLLMRFADCLVRNFNILFLYAFVFSSACENAVQPEPIEQDPDLGPIFLEPTLDMQIEQDLGDGQVLRILGSFGDACESNLDCEDNWCVSAGEENLCTYTCLGDECPNGWSCRAVSNNSQDVTLICVPQEERLCKPCESDRDCPSGGCYDLDGEQVCGTNCEIDDECQAGYLCQAVGADGVKLCSPSSGSCSCDANRSGEVRICENISESGRCYGRQTCGGEEGWSICNAQVPVLEVCNQIDDDCNGIADDIPGIGETCSQAAMIEGELRRCEGITLCVMGEESPQCSANIPQAEQCNFKDDDCDGVVDEGYEERDQACVVGVGVCRRYGVQVCNEAPRPELDSDEEWSPIVCNVRAGEAELEERCDGLDNDCDGETDEDYPNLGEICTVGEGFCRQSSVTRCDPSGVGVICEVSEGQGESERCDGVDNDCDGDVDEDFVGLNDFCTVGQGICQRRGLQVCSADSLSVSCSVSPAEPEVENCDNRDNDCDGLVDEGFALRGEACISGVGQCQAVGVTRCDEQGLTVVCSASASEANDELCDQVDNDCDGQSDEDFDGLGDPCVVGQGTCQAVGILSCTEDKQGIECSAEANPAVEELCDGLDNDCDGAVDENYPNLASVCSVGEGLCQQSGVIRCTENGTAVECSVDALAASEERCDGADNDCDGLIDESFSSLNEICEIGQGTCQRRGLLICNEVGLAVRCSVAEGESNEEICDDLDNDCDGTIDEGFADRALPCTVGTGICQAVGVTRCDEGGTEVICSAQANAPGEELCDNLDNDCDGEVDEDYLDLNRPCIAGRGVCTQNGVTRCAANQNSVVCSVSGEQAGEELCDNLDNDCDGEIDEDFAGINEFCTQGEGICQRRGLLACSADGNAVTCNVNAAEPELEVCDDLDNDCDGLIDEGYAPKGEACLNGTGACETVGVTRCSPDGQSVRCTAIAGEPTLEACDSIDNDCDGEIDEDFPSLGEICNEGVGFCRRSSVTRCAPSGLGVICEVSAGPGELELCDGVDNDCDDQVDEDFIALNTACTVGIGICQRRGLSICADNGIELQCSVEAAAPEIELCDDLDNDCDGLTDEGYAVRGEACLEGVGSCQEVGVTRCSPAGDEVLCSAQAGIPTLELCDGLDNDCDGIADEDFVARGEPCSVGTGACQSVGVTRCSADGQSVSCSASESEPSPELCDGLDNDCDQKIDETFLGKGEPCTDGVGACQAVGVNSCTLAGDRLICSAVASQPSVERCDSLDNDCDGVTDEAFAELGVVCKVGIGLCQQSGVNRCAEDGSGIRCSVEAGSPQVERCDNLDNDCDGLIDEEFPNLNEICTEGVGACQRRGLRVCADDALSLSCSAEAGEATAETCDDLDNDCDGVIDETFPTKGIACTQGVGTCQAVGINRCNEVGDAIICSAIEKPPELEVCDGLDNDCDGHSDETHPLVNTRCTVGQGLCLRSGVYQCNQNDPSLAVTCDAEQVNGAINEVCDYQDDDCDGQVDEEYITDEKYLSLAHCGACNSDCTTLWDGGAASYFVTPVCRVINDLAQCSYDCLAGYFDLDGLSNNGCEFSPDDTAVYVKPTQFGGQNVANCGDFDQACATLNYAVQIANGLGKNRIRVAEGIYRENFEIPNGFEILGGHQQNSWVRSPEVSTSHIDARGLVSVEQHRYGVIARNIDQPTLLDGFLITSDTPIQKGNSYGVYIIDSDDNLVMSNNRIVSGDGGRGQDGTLGVNGSDGVQGQAGNDSFGVSNPICIGTNLNLGGQGGIKTCGNSSLNGGDGAGSICPVFDQPAGIATAGQGISAGEPGVTGYAFRSPSTNSCIVGNGPRDAGTGGVGTNGNDGQGALGAASAQGIIQNQHWLGIDGLNGSLAGAGSGGGGGGGAAGVVVQYEFLAYDIGATGGGGGSGACGGEGGLGGESGGGSFGVFITYSVAINNANQLPIIQNNVITRGFGGSGGSGGPGGPGGRGGLPGLGGNAGNNLYQDFCSLQGGDGGKGGDGGNGGGGAGGSGGASYDFYLHNTSDQSLPYEVLNISLVGNEVNTGGSGGVGGISANVDIGLGAAGLSGVSGLIYVESP